MVYNCCNCLLNFGGVKLYQWWHGQIELLVLHVLNDLFVMHNSWNAIHFTELRNEASTDAINVQLFKSRNPCLVLCNTQTHHILGILLGILDGFLNVLTNFGCCVTFYFNSALRSRFSNSDWILFSDWRVIFNLYENQV